MDDVKNRLGSLADKNEDEGDIGPAPDGFESPDSQQEQSAQSAGQSQQPAGQEQGGQ